MALEPTQPQEEEEPTIPEMDRLTGQLYHLPGIIGNLGISIANAQKTLNSDYIHNIGKLLAMIKETLTVTDGEGNVENRSGVAAEVLQELIKQLAPSRYQFTETTLDFSADLSERKAKNLSGSIGGGFGGIVINAGYARAFAYDYRAAARVKTILNAIPADPANFATLLAQADKLTVNEQKLPATTDLEKEIFEGLKVIAESVKGVKEQPEEP